MLLNVAAFTLGVWWLQQQAELPALAGAFLVVALAGLALIAQRSSITRLRGAGAVLVGCACAGAGFYWAAGHAAWRLADRLPERVEGRDLRVVGVVAGLPERTARGWRFARIGHGVFEAKRDHDEEHKHGAEVSGGTELFVQTRQALLPQFSHPCGDSTRECVRLVRFT